MDNPNEKLIKKAGGLLKPRRADDRLMGDVASVLVTTDNNEYTGVSIDTGSGTGFCAEASAIAAMVTAGENEIMKIVAVWKDDSGKLYVLPPCGRCRLFIHQMSPEKNLDTEVVVSNENSVKLRELLPYSEWPEPLEGQTT